MFTLQHRYNYCNEKIHIPQVVAVKLLSQPEKIHKPFKERRSLTLRRQEALDIKEKFPRKLPVIVEKADGEKNLPDLDRSKFLVPDDMTMSQFVGIVRSRLRLKQNQAFYLMVKNRCLTTLSRNMAEVYWEHKDLDGFLYTTYTAQEMYGGCCTCIKEQVLERDKTSCAGSVQCGFAQNSE
ncbi:microtubule-associated proteins 1A/1B light chain 3A-like [Uloborus diversus]|uniref:microtubule-associated proteins 1A/1B light chain 3A-like n=1 Tax=Uloborus diversus TaxID=327109 RepID=UPI002409547F|nr:microtubule-associated proteins 1A/1B light chain 3A-like [Uloborus diversus]